MNDAGRLGSLTRRRGAVLILTGFTRKHQTAED